MSTMAEVFRDVFYESARQGWPDLTPQQFGDAARAWFARPQSTALTLMQVATGIEGELRNRYGPPQQ